MTTLDLQVAGVTNWAVGGDFYYIQGGQGQTLMQPLGWTTEYNRRNLGLRFHVPASVDPNATFNVAQLNIRTNNGTNAAISFAVMVGDGADFENTNDVDTGHPGRRYFSTLNTGTPVTLPNVASASTFYTVNLTVADVAAAISGNPNHNATGTYIVIIGYPALAGGQVGYQFISPDHPTQSLAPSLHLEFVSTAMTVKNDNSISNLGGAKLDGKAPECWGRWHGDDPEIQSKEALVPFSTGGSGDLPPTNILGVGLANPNGTSWALWANGGLQPDGSRVRIAYDPGIAWHKDRPIGHHSIFHEAYDNNSAFTGWNTSYWRSADGPLSTASLRFTVRHSGLPSNGFPEPVVIRAWNQGAAAWEIRLRGWTIDNQSHKPIMRKFTGGYAETGYAANRWLYAEAWRIEMQISEEAETYHLHARCYWQNSTVPTNVFNLACPDPTFDFVEFGTERSPLTGLVNVYVDDVDLWDDYYLNGYWRDERNKGTIEPVGVWETFEWDGAQFHEIDLDSQVQTESPLALDPAFTFDPLGDYEGERWNYNGPLGTTADPLQYQYVVTESYGWGSTKHHMTLYVPIGQPPDGGWPVYTWLHGGFFVSGSRGQIPNGLVVALIQSGWAVASLDIILSDIQPLINNAAGVSPQTYPAWNPYDDTARHPTQILDYKMAVNHLQKPFVKNLYLLSGLVVAGGHSAGSYPAMMAMATKDVTDDGNGLSYRVQDHTAYGYPVIEDPEIAGVYVTSGPADFDSMIDFDFTRRAGLTHFSTGRYTMQNTVALYFGHAFTSYPTAAQIYGSSVPNIIENIAPIENLKPFCYAGGRSDHLVPSDDHYQRYGWDQSKLVEDAYTARGVGNLFEVRRTAEAQHYQMPYRRDDQHLIQFLENIRVNQ